MIISHQVDLSTLFHHKGTQDCKVIEAASSKQQVYSLKTGMTKRTSSLFLVGFTPYKDRNPITGIQSSAPRML